MIRVDGIVVPPWFTPGPAAKTLSASHSHGRCVAWFLYVHEPCTYTAGMRALDAPIWFCGFSRTRFPPTATLLAAAVIVAVFPSVRFPVA